MASIVISITSTPITGSRSYVISDADAAKFIAWVQAQYPNVLDAQGNVVLSGSPPAPTAATVAQSLASWANALMRGTVANVQSYNQQTATATAVAGVSPIAIS